MKDVVEALEKSALYFKAEEDGWSVFCKGMYIMVQPAGEGSARATAGTGVFATDDNELALTALMNHLSGWVQKIGQYEFAPDGEVVLQIERDLDGGDSVDRMVSLAASYASQHVEEFRRVEQGDPLDEAIGADGGIPGSLLHALHSGLLD